MNENLEVKNISKNNDRFVYDYDILENTSNVFRKLNTSDECFLTICCNHTDTQTLTLFGCCPLILSFFSVSLSLFYMNRS